MAKRKHKLREISVTVPVLKDTPRDQAVDDLAFEAAQRLSATPVKRFSFVARWPSGISPIADNLEYHAWGTPRRSDAVPTHTPSRG